MPQILLNPSSPPSSQRFTQPKSESFRANIRADARRRMQLFLGTARLNGDEAPLRQTASLKTK
jgi:hypothetical protein